MKLPKTKEKEKTLKASKENETLETEEQQWKAADVSAETMNAKDSGRIPCSNTIKEQSRAQRRGEVSEQNSISNKDILQE